jgi:hypothetical protein
MKTEQILMCVVALVLGMLLANMLKSVCGCKVVEGAVTCDPGENAMMTLSEDGVQQKNTEEYSWVYACGPDGPPWRGNCENFVKNCEKIENGIGYQSILPVRRGSATERHVCKDNDRVQKCGDCVDEINGNCSFHDHN